MYIGESIHSNVWHVQAMYRNTHTTAYHFTCLKRIYCLKSRPAKQCQIKCLVTVQVGKDQAKAQSEKRFPLQKPRWEKTKLTIRLIP